MSFTSLEQPLNSVFKTALITHTPKNNHIELWRVSKEEIKFLTKRFKIMNSTKYTKYNY